MQLIVVRIGQGSSVMYQTVVDEMRHGVDMLRHCQALTTPKE
jgi:hypothetical protein